MSEGNTKKRKKEDDDKIGEKAAKWAEEFDKLDEDDQYTYLEEIAPRMTRMHLQFLQGIIGFDDDDEDGEGEFDDEGEDGEDGDDDEGEEGDEAGSD
jgi:hypothetical protein